MYRPGGGGGGTGGIRGRGWQSGRVNGRIVLGVCKQERPGQAGTGRNGDRLTERAGVHTSVGSQAGSTGSGS